MSYSDFSIDRVRETFGLSLDHTGTYFRDVPGVPVSHLLTESLKENFDLALAIGTEKARSEFIIAPILSEVRRQLHHEISLFSGIDFTVDASRGLNGICDFLISLSPEQMAVAFPVVAIVEAKNENFRAGYGQCIAEMIAARIFNQRRKPDWNFVSGIVTTGNIWKFLRLVDSTVTVDQEEYYIKDVEKIVGIIVSMLKSDTRHLPLITDN